MSPTILVTGGAGFIGSHTVLALLEQNYHVVVIDNLSNSSAESLRRVEKLTGKEVIFVEGDVRDKALLTNLFTDYSIDGVIHFAGLKAVGESVAQPLRYYSTNIDSTLVLCGVMQKFNVNQLIFSSSATVYGDPEELPLKETSRTGVGITNPYGQTKYMIEQLLRDVSIANTDWRITVLRYFNPIGAHPSGEIGEDPNGPPNNLMPFVAQVAVGKRGKVMVFGDDYATPDGTGVRDYIHVMDLAAGHVAALQHEPAGFEVYNLGTGVGISVLEAIDAFSKAAGHPVPYEVAPRRPGDIASNYADASKAERELEWRAERSLQDACNDAWRWQSQNPDGFISSL
jgi:UDP-glucose 4-epimerase